MKAVIASECVFSWTVIWALLFELEGQPYTSTILCIRCKLTWWRTLSSAWL